MNIADMEYIRILKNEVDMLEKYIKKLEEYLEKSYKDQNTLKIENAKLIKENREIENKNNRLQNIIFNIDTQSCENQMILHELEDYKEENKVLKELLKEEGNIK